MINTSKQSFSNLIDKIIVNEFSEYNDIYLFEKDDLLTGLFNGNDTKEDPELGVNQFGVGETLEYVSTISATFLTLLKIVGWFKDRNQKNDEIQKSITILWKDNMIKEGLSEEKAERISQNYQKELKNILQKN